MKAPSLKQVAEAIVGCPGVSPLAKAEILALIIQGYNAEDRLRIALRGEIEKRERTGEEMDINTLMRMAGESARALLIAIEALEKSARFHDRFPQAESVRSRAALAEIVKEFAR